MRTKEADVDYNLARLSLAGDIQAWNQLYSKSSEIVNRYTKKYLWSFNLSVISYEDIISEAYSRAYEKLSTFKGDSRFSTWMCGFARLIVWEENRKYKRRKQTYRNYIFSQSAFYSRDPCDIVLELELYKSLWSAFEMLLPIEAYILEAYVVHERTFSELSRVTHLSVRAVKKCYQSSLGKLSKNFHNIHHKKEYGQSIFSI